MDLQSVWAGSDGLQIHPTTIEQVIVARHLNLVLLLSSPRKGEYSGKILIVNERSDKAIRYVKFVARFQEDNELLPVYVEIGDCVFPDASQYNFEIYFSARDGSEALKGEHPFTVVSYEE